MSEATTTAATTATTEATTATADAATTTAATTATTEANTGDATTATTEVKTGTAEAKPADKAEPIVYEFKAPEGMTANADDVKAFEAEMRELGVPKDKAEKLFAMGIKSQQSTLDAIKAAQEKTASEWVASAKTDKEFGGEAFDANLAIAKAARDKFGTPELSQFLEASGLGNHPEMVRFFYRTGKATSQDGFPAGRGAPATGKSAGQVLYDNTPANL